MANQKQEELLYSFGLPSVITTNGNARGYFHNEGSFCTQYGNGTFIWCHMGYIHRNNGPAIERSGEKDLWYLWGEKTSVADYSWSIFLEQTLL